MSNKMKNMRAALLFCLVAVISLSVSAQNVTVTGTVTDKTGETVIGASVVQKGNTSNGTITDIDGNFSLSVPANSTLVFSYVGMTSQEIPLKGKTKVEVVMEDDAQALEEVVVIGYGSVKRKDLTGSVATVNSEVLAAVPVASATEALQGKMAGVQITTTEGSPDAEMKIRVRGGGSITGDNTPLFIVDGFPVESISDIPASDIEDMTVLKDASSTAIYGSRGANGVILITTKRGKAGRLALNYSGSVTLETLKDKSPAMSASDYITWRRWAYYNSDPVNNPRGDQPNYDKDQIYFAASGDPAALANVNKGWNNGTWDGSRVTDTDWADIVTQTGITHEHTISGSGGNETAQAFFSIGYLNNQGTQKGQEYERYNFSMSVDLQVKPWFKMGGSINGSWAVQDYGYSRTGQSSGSGPVDIYSAAKAIPRFGVPYDEEGNIITNPCGSTTNVYTVIDEWNKSTDNRQTFRALGSFYGQFDFGKIWAPLEGLSYKISFGPDFRHYRQGIFISKDSAVKMGSKNYAK